MTFTSIRSFRALIVASALTLAAVPAIHAQNAKEISVVNVPFAFEVGSSHFPAGHYTISDLQEDRLLQVRGASGAKLTPSRAEVASTPSANTKVAFHRYGDTYFLSQIWTAGTREYVQCIESGAEKQVRKNQVAQSNTQSSGIQLAMVDAVK